VKARTFTPNRLAVALILVVAFPAAAEISVRIVNDSSLTLMEFYASPGGDKAWGEDLLHVGVLPSGEAGNFAIIQDGGTCDYDLRFVLEDGRDRLDRVDVCARPVYRLGER
jgi:hypothetical protein